MNHIPASHCNHIKQAYNENGSLVSDVHFNEYIFSKYKDLERSPYKINQFLKLEKLAKKNFGHN
tara:strand:- start:1297 stop:1488 length:192 start_codon:yes stop_codon:yes gene_type:complete